MASKVTTTVVNHSLKSVKNEEQHSENPTGYPDEVPKQPRPERQTEYTVTDELRASLRKRMKVIGRGADRKLVEQLSARFKGYTFHRSNITKIADEDGPRASKIAFHLALLLGCPPPPVHGSEIGEAWSKLQQLKELDSELYEKEVGEIEKAIAALLALKRIREREQ